ncbi:hypothetical protein GCM10010961_09130 [Pseudodonghicola xiamenensis]|uniref:TRAP transporter small permease protein n=2 Tax=Pseudodonghicola xiamenensis TaxID=337702 RepID=A0A8J3H3U7_9RHOB|nr:hypothetical protein GCM10010961_09130 [Pseudodonghicola xiamenensis]
MAVAGGLVLSALIVMTCLSIIGRRLGIGPITGDFELVEAGVAFAIFAFLPLCQITAGHASVDVLTNLFPARVNRFLRMVTEAIFAAVLVLIAWKLFDGMLAKKQHNETSFLLQFPLWWAYAASLLGAVVAAVVGIYMAGVRISECLTGRIQIWDGVETGHPMEAEQ